MAFATNDVTISPSQGWVLVATNPTNLIIRPNSSQRWYLAVTAGTTPPSTLKGMLMGEENTEERPPFTISSAITGTVYIRVSEAGADSQSFSIITN